MEARQAFRDEILKWLADNGISEVSGLAIARDFAYEPDNQIIRIGFQEYDEVGSWFKEFLSEHGCEFVDLPTPILSFLHEVGHSQTIKWFSDHDLNTCAMYKIKAGRISDWKTSVMKYWTAADEFAANRWVVNFLNRHMEAACDLWNIFFTYWNEIATDTSVRFFIRANIPIDL